jgi:hypothetical protein
VTVRPYRQREEKVALPRGTTHHHREPPSSRAWQESAVNAREWSRTAAVGARVEEAAAAVRAHVEEGSPSLELLRSSFASGSRSTSRSKRPPLLFPATPCSEPRSAALLDAERRGRGRAAAWSLAF